jgi:hypothetical protein
MPTQSIDLSAVTDTTFNGTAVDAVNLNGSEIWTGVKPWDLLVRIPTPANRLTPAYNIAINSPNTAPTGSSATWFFYNVDNGPLIPLPHIYGGVFNISQSIENGPLQINAATPFSADATLLTKIVDTQGLTPQANVNITTRGMTGVSTGFQNNMASVTDAPEGHADTYLASQAALGATTWQTGSKPPSGSSQTSIYVQEYYNANYAINLALLRNIPWGTIGNSVTSGNAQNTLLSTNTTTVATVGDDGTVTPTVGYRLHDIYAASAVNSYGDTVPASWRITFGGWLDETRYTQNTDQSYTAANSSSRPLTRAAFVQALDNNSLPTNVAVYEFDFISDTPSFTLTYIGGNNASTGTGTTYPLQRFDSVTGLQLSGLFRRGGS